MASLNDLNLNRNMKIILLISLCFITKITVQEKFEIAKVSKNRVFIVLYNPRSEDKEFIDQLKETILDLNKNKLIDFTNKKVSISFFSDKKHADYKPETNEEYGEWAKSYIAEYTNDDKKLVIYPLDVKKLKHVILKK